MAQLGSSSAQSASRRSSETQDRKTSASGARHAELSTMCRSKMKCHAKTGSHTATSPKPNSILVFSLAIILPVALVALAQLTSGQSTKGRQQQQQPQQLAPLPQSPAGQVRQQQQQQQTYSQQPSKPSGQASKQPARVRPQQQQQPQQQQIEQSNIISQNNAQSYPQQQQQEQQREDQVAAQTEDPLADSEPALYGSVAGQPGVDFPAYTRIPKTSFTCEGKGFDFGFYADEEAGCQVYHVCWSGRRESFLCGVGTVFNQAILACDYWHSVDCSKSSQFYGVNSELGKAGAEPASGQQQQQQQVAARPSIAPPSSSSSLSGGSQFGEPISQRRLNSVAPIVQQQQTSYGNDNELSFDSPQQQPSRAAPATSLTQNTNNFVPQRTLPIPSESLANNQQQRIEVSPPSKTNSRRIEQQPLTTTTLPTPIVIQPQQQQQQVKRPQTARTFNVDFNQKVNSLIESPVRPPIKSSGKTQQQRQQVAQIATTRRPAIQQTKGSANLAQLAVARAQQSGSQTPNNSGSSRKTSPSAGNNYRQQQQQQQQQQLQQQQQQFDSDLDEPQPQQQLNTFDDSPVQTSTVQSTSQNNYNRQQQQREPQFAQGIPQSQQTIVQSGGSGDGSSAITMQYDTLQPSFERQARESSSSSPSSASSALGGTGGSGAPLDSNYDSSLEDSSSAGSNSDDFRSAGAKAAASHNQNWYIMRAI